jgi:hypothetical protein
MNFDTSKPLNMPELHWSYGYVGFWVVAITAAGEHALAIPEARLALGSLAPHDEDGNANPVADRRDGRPEQDVAERAVAVGSHDEQIDLLALDHPDQLVGRFAVEQVGFGLSPERTTSSRNALEIVPVVARSRLSAVPSEVAGPESFRDVTTSDGRVVRPSERDAVREHRGVAGVGREGDGDAASRCGTAGAFTQDAGSLADRGARASRREPGAAIT